MSGYAEARQAAARVVTADNWLPDAHPELIAYAAAQDGFDTGVRWAAEQVASLIEVYNAAGEMRVAVVLDDLWAYLLAELQQGGTRE